MSIKKNKNQLIISVIVGVAIAVISYQVIVKLKIENENLKKLTQTSASAPIKKITYVVAKTDIKKGDKIQADNLTTKQFPIEIEGAISDTSKIAGFSAVKDIKADSPIVEDYFKASDMDLEQGELRNGFRAVSVALETLPSYVKAGTHVDIFFAKSGIQAQDVQVLSVLDSQDDAKKFIMLELKDRDVPAFITALGNDKAVLVQRNRHEKTGYKFSVSNTAIFSQMPQSAPPELVEVSDITYDEPPKRSISSAGAQRKVSLEEVPVVKSQYRKSAEIELISGDKKMIVGAEQ